MAEEVEVVEIITEKKGLTHNKIKIIKDLIIRRKVRIRKKMVNIKSKKVIRIEKKELDMNMMRIPTITNIIMLQDLRLKEMSPLLLKQRFQQ